MHDRRGLYQSTKAKLVSLLHGSRVSAHRDQTQKIQQVLEHVVDVVKAREELQLQRGAD